MLTLLLIGAGGLATAVAVVCVSGGKKDHTEEMKKYEDTHPYSSYEESQPYNP